MHVFSFPQVATKVSENNAGLSYCRVLIDRVLSESADHNTLSNP
jgi:hypothetical protein